MSVEECEEYGLLTNHFTTTPDATAAPSRRTATPPCHCPTTHRAHRPTTVPPPAVRVNDTLGYNDNYESVVTVVPEVMAAYEQVRWAFRTSSDKILLQALLPACLNVMAGLYPGRVMSPIYTWVGPEPPTDSRWCSLPPPRTSR